MNTKKGILCFVFAFILVLSAFCVMAADAGISVAIGSIADIPQEGSEGSQKVNITITNTGEVENLEDITLTLSHSDEFTVTVGSYAKDLLVEGSTKAELTITTDEKTDLKGYTIKADVIGFYVSDPTKNVTDSKNSNSFTIYKQYCEVGDVGSDLEITDVDYDEDEYAPGDDIVLTVDVKNKEEYDVYVKAALIAKEDGEVLDHDKELIKEEDFEYYSKQTVELKLEVPSNADEGEYFIYVKAYRTSHEDDECAQESYSIDIEVEPYDVKMENEGFSFDSYGSVECGSIFTFSGRIRNIGFEEQKRIKVEYIDSLGNSEYDIIRDLVSGDKENFEIKNLFIPTNAKEGTYVASITIYHEYDDGDYESEKSYTKEFIVQGNCFVEMKEVSITPEQITRPIEETEFTIKINLQNIGNVETIYNISVEGYEAWAELIKVEPASLTLKEGASGYAYVYLKAKEGSEGTQTFNAVIESDSYKETKAISVDVTPISEIRGWNIPDAIKDNWPWIIVDAALVILIVVLIVVLASKAGKKKKVVEAKPVEEKEKKPKKKISKKK